jgi:hypothetical protein
MRIVNLTITAMSTITYLMREFINENSIKDLYDLDVEIQNDKIKYSLSRIREYDLHIILNKQI